MNAEPQFWIEFRLPTGQMFKAYLWDNDDSELAQIIRYLAAAGWSNGRLGPIDTRIGEMYSAKVS